MVDAVNTHGVPALGAVVCSTSEVGLSVASTVGPVDGAELLSATSEVCSGGGGSTPGGGGSGGGFGDGGLTGVVVSPSSEADADGMGGVGVTGGGVTGVTGGVTELDVEGLSVVVSPFVDGVVEHATHTASRLVITKRGAGFTPAPGEIPQAWARSFATTGRIEVER